MWTSPHPSWPRSGVRRRAAQARHLQAPAESPFDKAAFGVTFGNAEIDVTAEFAGKEFFAKFIVNAVPTVIEQDGQEA